LTYFNCFFNFSSAGKTTFCLFNTYGSVSLLIKYSSLTAADWCKHKNYDTLKTCEKTKMVIAR